MWHPICHIFVPTAEQMQIPDWLKIDVSQGNAEQWYVGTNWFWQDASVDKGGPTIMKLDFSRGRDLSSGRSQWKEL